MGSERHFVILVCSGVVHLPVADYVHDDNKLMVLKQHLVSIEKIASDHILDLQLIYTLKITKEYVSHCPICASYSINDIEASCNLEKTSAAV